MKVYCTSTLSWNKSSHRLYNLALGDPMAHAAVSMRHIKRFTYIHETKAHRYRVVMPSIQNAVFIFSFKNAGVLQNASMCIRKAISGQINGLKKNGNAGFFQWRQYFVRHFHVPFKTVMFLPINTNVIDSSLGTLVVKDSTSSDSSQVLFHM